MKEHQFQEKKNWLKKGLIVLFWLCVWQLAAHLAQNKILLVGPWQAFLSLLQNIVRPDFLKIVIYSLCRIGFGFFLALFCGFALGALSYRYRFLEEFLAPVMTTFKSIPVASFVVLLLIWFGSSLLSFFISFLIVFPNVYVNTIAGFKSTDRQLLEMAQVFHVKGWKRFFYLYRPAFMPYLDSCLKISLGMGWKSGVAAEVIGIPKYSLGERLYMSKIYLDTADLFAWTFLIILLSFLFEKAVLYLVKRFGAWNPCLKCDTDVSCNTTPQTERSMVKNIKQQNSGKIRQSVRMEESQMTESIAKPRRTICIRNISKSYGDLQVLQNFSLMLEPGGHYCLMAPSGGGKTTLLKLIGRTEQPDFGTIEGIPEHIGMVFQEDRLCENYDLITNVMLTTTRKPQNRKEKREEKRRQAADEIAQIKQEALQILPQDCLDKPVRELSGGMKRRCAILRAILSRADIIIMDEPFTGLDEETRKKTADYILEKLKGRTLLITTHREEDATLLHAIRINLPPL